MLLDVLRGFALYGIIQINLPGFVVGLDPLYALVGLPTSSADRLVFSLNCFFVEAKFYPLFAFLFGYGFALQWQGLKRSKLAPEPLLVRRYVFLLVLGVLHGTLLFFGDILTMYALAGLVMIASRPATREAERRRIAFWATASAVIICSQFYVPSPVAPNPTAQAILDRVTQNMADLASGPFIPLATERAQLYAMAQVYQALTFLPTVLFYMSLGAFAARVGLLRSGGRYRQFWLRCLGFGVLVGIPVNLLFTWTQWQLAEDPNGSAWIAAASELTNQLAATLTPAYVALIALATEAAQRSRWLGAVIRTLARTGRLALTNYLTQSCVMVLLLTNLGVGLATHLSLSDMAATGLLLCLTQTAAATLYLRRFRTGPIEALWRRVVYGRVSARSTLGS